MITAVICDIDGTLVDSVDVHAKGMAGSLRSLGCSLDYTEVRRQIGQGSEKLIVIFVCPKNTRCSHHHEKKKRLEDFKPPARLFLARLF